MEVGPVCFLVLEVCAYLAVEVWRRTFLAVEGALSSVETGRIVFCCGSRIEACTAETARKGLGRAWPLQTQCSHHGLNKNQRV